ncbi:MAG: hypothetical protein GX962_14695 [Epulopiscium sp.]|nr:hypothetical protein [Candidatus Epulonipiscium sp.]
MSRDNDLFELMTKIYSDMQEGFKQVNKRIDDIESEISGVKKVVINIENDHGKKLDSLFDGYKQTYEKLTHIEDEVSKHDEIIYKRVK